MSTYTADQLLTVAEVAERLEMTADGVYKLIQRGKLDAVRLSARKTRVSAQSLEGYMHGSQAWVDRYLSAQPRIDVQTLRDMFTADAGMSPEDWLAAWKRDEVEDTAENMQRLARAAALVGNRDKAADPAPEIQQLAAPTSRKR
jgi:excisionase family DNA binding protein